MWQGPGDQKARRWLPLSTGLGGWDAGDAFLPHPLLSSSDVFSSLLSPQVLAGGIPKAPNQGLSFHTCDSGLAVGSLFNPAARELSQGSFSLLTSSGSRGGVGAGVERETRSIFPCHRECRLGWGQPGTTGLTAHQAGDL